MKKLLFFFGIFFFSIPLSASANFVFGEKILNFLSVIEQQREYFQKTSHFLPILMFHRIVKLDPKRDFLQYNNSISPEKFELFAKFFSENDIQTLTFFDLRRFEEGIGVLPKKAVILTFDDGYSEHFATAKILEKYGLRGVFFIISNRIGQPGYLTAEEIREMALAGHEIGSHSVTHSNLENLSSEKLHAEIADSKAKIEEVSEQIVISFCYPSGKYDARAFRFLAEEGYEFARTTHTGNFFFPNKNFELTMTRIFPETSILSLQYLFSK